MRSPPEAAARSEVQGGDFLQTVYHAAKFVKQMAKSSGSRQPARPCRLGNSMSCLQPRRASWCLKSRQAGAGSKTTPKALS